MQRFVFPAIVERGRSGFGVYFPDLPGCASAADSLEDVGAMAREALQLHIQGMLEDGVPIPSPSAIDQARAEPESDVVGVLLVEANTEGAPAALVITLPKHLLERVDEAARSGGRTREDVLADGARELLKAS